eukprot:6195084-Pleurochrysis_carterae.AAC.2
MVQSSIFKNNTKTLHLPTAVHLLVQTRRAQHKRSYHALLALQSTPFSKELYALQSVLGAIVASMGSVHVEWASLAVSRCLMLATKMQPRPILVECSVNVRTSQGIYAYWVQIADDRGYPVRIVSTAGLHQTVCDLTVNQTPTHKRPLSSFVARRIRCEAPASDS